MANKIHWGYLIVAYLVGSFFPFHKLTSKAKSA